MTTTRPVIHTRTAWPANSDENASLTPILEARALTKHFGGERHLFTRTPVVYAVNDVSFSVSAGETFAIVGESGCGKSTLGRMLLRLIDSTQGRVLYQGQDITHLHGAPMQRLRREMQLIFQDPFASLNPGMTVGQIVGEPIALHRLARNGPSAASVSRSCCVQSGCSRPTRTVIRTSFQAASGSGSALRVHWRANRN